MTGDAATGLVLTYSPASCEILTQSCFYEHSRGTKHL